MSRMICVLVAALALFALAIWRSSGEWAPLATVALLALVIAAAWLNSVRGYTLSERELTIERRGWATRLALQELRDVSGNSAALQQSWRLFGVGGLFSWTGVYWKRGLGRFRAYVTDPERAVVLEFSKLRVVISPDDPHGFIVQARTILKNRGPEA
jgi:hypothetical protein